MTDTSRPYRSTLREDQARETRRRIVEAAQDLFVEQGYARTTIDAIAARAEVSRKTVFTSVGGKAAALKLAWDWSLAGDDEPVPMADRPTSRAIRAERDPRQALHIWVELQSAVAIRLAPLYEVLLIAADSDPQAAELRTVVEGHRTAGARWFVEHLQAIGGLRPDLDLAQATSITEVLMDPAPAARLVHRAGWTLEAYTDLCERAAVALLLADQ